MTNSNKNYPLFNAFNPFDITERNLVIRNNLILLQCLSQHPWLVRKIVQYDKSRPGYFNLNLYGKFHLKKHNIDCEMPYLKDRDDYMFIEDKNEMWPCLLQKGLAK